MRKLTGFETFLLGFTCVLVFLVLIYIGTISILAEFGEVDIYSDEMYYKYGMCKDIQTRCREEAMVGDMMTTRYCEKVYLDCFFITYWGEMGQ